MRDKLIKWANDKFGEILVSDVFYVNERTVLDKQGREIKKLIMHLKKKEKIKNDWLKKEVFKLWADEIKQIIGENLILKIYSTEGNELQHDGRLIKEENKSEYYKEAESHIYNYQFNLVIWKKI